MSCLDEDAILAWLGGQLDTEELGQAERHIDRCADCRRLVSALAGERSPARGADGEDASIPPRAESVGAIVAGKFQIEAIAGRGGMGRVYAARDLEQGTRVALKRVEVDDARFAREARVLAELAHPAIVRHVADGLSEDGARYLVMEWLEGENLAERLRRGPLSVEETLALGSRVADALGAAHAHGVVHRDIKPSNLFLPGGRVEDATIVDFGLARAPAPGSVETRSGILLGTPGYMAPEQARGETTIGPRADVFSLGCVLYECLTGERAFSGSNVVAVLAKLLTGKPPRPRARMPHVPRGLDALVTRMLAREPAQRPANGGVVKTELEVLGSLRALVRPSKLVRVALAISATAFLVGGVALVRSEARDRLPSPVASEAVLSAAESGAIVAYPARTGTPPEAATEYKEGLLALREAALKRARTHLERAVELDPALAAAHLRLAVWTDTVMTAAESRAHYQAARANASKLSPRDEGLLQAVAPAFFLEPPDLEEAGRRLADLARSHPDDAELGLLGIGVSGSTTRPGDYDEILRIDPRFAYAWWARANAQFRVNDGAAARESIDRCLDAAPGATLCVLLRTRTDAREGRCEEMERDARLVVALENGGDAGYAQLANALTGRGADRDAVEEAVHARALASAEPRARQKVELHDRAEVAAAYGDFVDAERLARSLEELVKDEPFVQEHVRWAILLVDILEEQGDLVGAGKVGDAFLRRRAAWRSVGKRPNDEPVPYFLFAAQRAGLRTQGDVERERATWAAEWQARAPGAAEEVWIQGWARPARSPGEVRLAVQAMQRSTMTKTILPSPVGWILPQGLSHAYGGRLQIAAGHPTEAVATLGSVVRHCSVLSDALVHRRSQMWLGQAYEANHDTAHACEAYAGVLRHWGHARPQSVTADAARARIRALRCGTTPVATRGVP
jgi:eukaryotic-like serine/threonine-protein kinase